MKWQRQPGSASVSGAIQVFSQALTEYKGKLTEKPRLSMEWQPENYLRLMTKHCVAIDMSSYPGGTLVEPKNANVDHLCQVLDGWNKGDIKWVALTSDQVEKKCEELASLTSNKVNNADVTATQERMPQAESSM
jgi:hypothetical protein